MTESGPRFKWRFLAGLLLAPTIYAALMRLRHAGIGLAYGTDGNGWHDPGPPLIVRYLLFWLGWAAGMALPAWLLYKLGKTRLRHHLLTGAALGSIPLIITLANFAEVLRLQGRGASLQIPYPCTELVRFETFNLQGGIGTLLQFSLMMVLFKWIAHGFTREASSWGWKLAGGAYLLAWAIFLVEPFHFVNRDLPSWTNWVFRTCEQILR
jgi:hypothetical protein